MFIKVWILKFYLWVLAKPRKMAESAVFLTMDSVHQRRFVTETEIVVHTNFLAVSPVSVIFALLNSNMHGLNENHISFATVSCIHRSILYAPDFACLHTKIYTVT